jgi:Flp pilus assembly pilin Flp
MRVTLATGLLPNGGCVARNLSSHEKEITLVVKYYIKARNAMERLGSDEAGVVSFEYVIVAALVIGVVAAVFSGIGAGTVGGALTQGLTAIGTAMTAAV